ncbi:MAG: DNA polymerase III subunit chi [Alphaproteobacteria bacterium]|nr:DNA polymerase III subunit chi [Alphaproteobacteria bacterium]
MIVDFYHLTASPLEKVLPAVAEKILAGGERLLVVAEEPHLARLDEQLWTYARTAFLPHGRGDAAAQPVFLSANVEATNGATNVALADGAWREEALAFERIFYFFDASNLESARSAWRDLKARPEAAARYWKQDERGKWVQGP